MEALIPIFRLLHFLGFSLLLGGAIASIVLVKKEGHALGMKLAHTCTHALAAPGLMLLMLTGIMHASTTHWVNFKGAGYMHAKVLFVVVILLLLVFDIRTQKKVIRGNFSSEIVESLVKKRQTLAMSIAALTLCVMWLISSRPF